MSLCSSFCICSLITVATIRVALAALKDSFQAGFRLVLEGCDTDLHCRGFFTERLSERTACPYWFLQKVLDFLSSAPFGLKAELRELLYKAVFLLTLAFGLMSYQLHTLTRQLVWTGFSADKAFSGFLGRE